MASSAHKPSSKSGEPTAVTSKAPRTELKILAKRECDRARGKTRINIGRAFERWRQFRELNGFKSDPEMAFFLLDMACGEHLPDTSKTRGPRKTPAAPQPQTEVSVTDSPQSSLDSQSDTESQDKQVQPERQTKDESDLEVLISSIAPAYGFASLSSSSNTATKDDAMEWEEIKDELAQTTQRLEERLNAMRSFSGTTSEPISMRGGNEEEDEVKMAVSKSSLTGLFRTCHQCGEPVLEFKTLTSGSLVRIQWECSKGHLMWLFPNYNPT